MPRLACWEDMMRATGKIPFGTTAAEIALMPPKEMRILPGAGHRIDGKQYDGTNR